MDQQCGGESWLVLHNLAGPGLSTDWWSSQDTLWIFYANSEIWQKIVSAEKKVINLTRGAEPSRASVVKAKTIKMLSSTDWLGKGLVTRLELAG